MLLQKNANLEDILTATLALRPNLTVKQIAETLKSRGHIYTERGIYKELKKLENQSVVVKTKQFFSLRLSWLINVQAFVDKAYEVNTSPKYLSEIFSSAKDKLIQRFSNLRKLDFYWIQAMMALHEMYPEKAMCLWIPHQWFHLSHDFALQQFYRAIDITRGARYHIIGMDCYLSRLAEATLPKDEHYSFAKSPFAEQMGTYYSFIENHLITVNLDQTTVKRINDLFLKISSAAEMDHALIDSIFSAKVKASLKIEVAEQKVRRLRKQFEEFFGAKIN